MANGNAGLLILGIGGLAAYAAFKAGQKQPNTAPAATPVPLGAPPLSVPEGSPIEQPLDPEMVDIFGKLQSCAATWEESAALWDYTQTLVPETQAEADWINGLFDTIRAQTVRCFPTKEFDILGQPIPYVTISGVHVGDCGCSECRAKVGHDDEPCCAACAANVGACACQDRSEEDVSTQSAMTGGA